MADLEVLRLIGSQTTLIKTEQMTPKNISEMPPPWHVFPSMQPSELPARQGAEEAWIYGEWLPFWSGLLPETKAQYLEYWNASPAWRDAIRFFIEEGEGFDDAADAVESEEFLREMNSKRPKGGTLWERIRLFLRRC